VTDEDLIRKKLVCAPPSAFRHVLVHGYPVVNPDTVRKVLEKHLGDVDQFIAAIRARLSA
jgi:uncharacterized protein YutE (UPF0331/DUF86 family)